MTALILTAALTATPVDNGLEAVDAARVAIFAYCDRSGPTAWPMTPYRDGAQAVVTSTLAFMHKSDDVRRDGRVALLAGGWLLQGTAAVHADASGDEFVRRFLAAERRKYPPVDDILAVPLHRWLFDWYFGRVFMAFAPALARPVPGSDRATLITLDAGGLPVITPLTEPALDSDAIALCDTAGRPLAGVADGPATILLHAEDAGMRDLRQLHLRGTLRDGVFHVRSRRGALAPTAVRGWWSQLRQQLELRRRGRDGRARIEAWQ